MSLEIRSTWIHLSCFCALLVMFQYSEVLSAPQFTGPQKIRIKNLEDLIHIGFDSLFPEEPLTNDSAFKSIKFRLYADTKNISNYEEFTIDELGMENKTSSLKANAPFKIMIHGFLSHCDKRIFPKSVIQAYLDKMESTKSPMNIICVDWGTLANPSALPNPLLYGESVKSTRMVGEKTADLLATLYNKELVRDFSDIHIVGSSLGAHIAGVTGHMLKTNWGLPTKIGRITALDPARLFFKEKAVEEKLNDDDAEFVEVIHTNMGQLGMEGKIGMADFYPNGGRIQDRCYMFANPIAMLAEQLSGRCSHLIAATYFKESIEHGNITACKAENWHDYRSMTRTTGCKERVGFGDNCPKSARGQFYLMM